MADEFSFGRWLQRRRKALDLTQAALAQRVGCAPDTLRKIEADLRRPSRELAEQLARALALRPSEQAAFIRVAREEQAVDALPLPTQSVSLVAFVPPTGLPTGTVTFLFTDIEGSTQLWEQHPEAMHVALARHDTILREAVEAHGGVIFKTTGDGVCAAFARAPDALAASLSAQRALQNDVWGMTGPLWVRMALHIGAAEVRTGDYFGPPLNRVNRLMAAGHGGQVLLSMATQELVRDNLPSGIELRDLGQHRLKDLTRPEHVFDVVAPSLLTEFPPLTTLDARRHNLPVHPNPLIGRETEVAQVCALLRRSDVRLVTLTGSGGVGKTRLAFQIAAELLDDYPSGIYFVSLEPIIDSAFVTTAITQALGITEVGSRPLMDTLRAYLRDKQLLLLLDNFEQVAAAAPLLSELLSAAPQLNILVTSRGVLHIRGEKQFPVLPLALVNPKHIPSLEMFSQYAAVALFIQRALDVKPDFTITNDNAPAVAEICTRLDGLPLAIELAAAWIKLFSPQALLAQLEKQLALLTGGARDFPIRQQTLRNTIAWSYNLLDAEGQKLFRQLRVFVGGWTLEAAQEICTDDKADILAVLQTLIEHSVISIVDIDDVARFTMLEVVRAFVSEQLIEVSEQEVIQQKHLMYFLAFAERAERLIHGPDQLTWLKRVDREQDNLRRALSCCFDVSQPPSLQLRFVAALAEIWIRRGYRAEAAQWINVVLTITTERSLLRSKVLNIGGTLAAPHERGIAQAMFAEALAIGSENDDISTLADALFGLGWVAALDGDVKTAISLYDQSLTHCRTAHYLLGEARVRNSLGEIADAQQTFEALRIYRDLGDLQGIAWSVIRLGMAARNEANGAQAETLIQEGIALQRRLGDKEAIAWGLSYLADAYQLQQELFSAKEVLQESLQLFAEVDNQFGIAYVHLNIGDNALVCADALEAAQHFDISLRLFQTLDYVYGMALSITGSAGVAALLQEFTSAARLSGASEYQLTAIDSHLPPDVRMHAERTIASSRLALGTLAFEAAWAAGQALTLDQAVDEAFILNKSFEMRKLTNREGLDNE